MGTIRLRRGTASQWTAQNPVLQNGEPGFESDTNKIKIGNGATAWNSLSYVNTSASVILPADLIEQIQDVVGSMFIDGAYINTVYSDTTGKVTIEGIDIPESIGEVEDLTVASFVADPDAFTHAAVLQMIVDELENGGVVEWGDVGSKPTIITNFAALVGAANKIAYFTSANTFAFTDLTAFMRTLLDDGSASAARTTLDVYSKAEVTGIANPQSIMGIATIKGASNIVTTVPANTVEGASAGRIPGLAVTVTGEGRPAVIHLTLPSYRHSASLTNIGIAQGTTVLQSQAIQVADNVAPGAFVQLSVATGTLAVGTSYSFYAYGRQPVAASGQIDSHNQYPSELRVMRG